MTSSKPKSDESEELSPKEMIAKAFRSQAVEIKSLRMRLDSVASECVKCKSTMTKERIFYIAVICLLAGVNIVKQFGINI